MAVRSGSWFLCFTVNSQVHGAAEPLRHTVAGDWEAQVSAISVSLDLKLLSLLALSGAYEFLGYSEEPFYSSEIPNFPCGKFNRIFINSSQALRIVVMMIRGLVGTGMFLQWIVMKK